MAGANHRFVADGLGKKPSCFNQHADAFVFLNAFGGDALGGPVAAQERFLDIRCAFDAKLYTTADSPDGEIVVARSRPDDIATDDFIGLGDNFGNALWPDRERLFECQPALVQVPGPGGEHGHGQARRRFELDNLLDDLFGCHGGTSIVTSPKTGHAA